MKPLTPLTPLTRLTTLTALGALAALKARPESPAAARRAQTMAERLQALRTHQTTLEERERALLPRLQLAALERDRTAADIRMGEAWELAIAASLEFYLRLRREAGRLAKERVATGRAIVALEGRLPAVWRVGVAVEAGEAVTRALEQAPSGAGGDGLGLPTAASLPEPRQREAEPVLVRGADRRPLLATAASGTSAPEGAIRRRGD